MMRYIVPKGFIAVDGASLTVCDVNEAQRFFTSIGEDDRQDNDEDDDNIGSNWFTIMLVPHTQQSVILPTKDVGDIVNLEVDVLGKLVEKSIEGKMLAIGDQMKGLQTTIESQSKELAAMGDVVLGLSMRLHQMEERLTKGD